jgi:UPF0176 protein
MSEYSVVGTIIIAKEGYNGTVCAPVDLIGGFNAKAEEFFGRKLSLKSSFHDSSPFRTVKVKIKKEIVTFGRDVQMELGKGTHVDPRDWNRLIKGKDVVVLDTRNDYEFLNGSFLNAINPKTEKFSELPDFIKKDLDIDPETPIAMYCTGGIRCEKVAPYLVAQGFKNVYQLDGGILKYLETIPKEEQLWTGECFVFDDRITVDNELREGNSPDHSFSKNK